MRTSGPRLSSNVATHGLSGYISGISNYLNERSVLHLDNNTACTAPATSAMCSGRPVGERSACVEEAPDDQQSTLVFAHPMTVQTAANTLVLTPWSSKLPYSTLFNDNSCQGCSKARARIANRQSIERPQELVRYHRPAQKLTADATVLFQFRFHLLYIVLREIFSKRAVAEILPPHSLIVFSMISISAS